MVYTKEEYRLLQTVGGGSKLISFRVPNDLPLDNSEIKMIIAELDLLIVHDLDYNVNLEILDGLGLSDKTTKAIVKLMRFFNLKNDDG